MAHTIVSEKAWKNILYTNLDYGKKDSEDRPLFWYINYTWRNAQTLLKPLLKLQQDAIKWIIGCHNTDIGFHFKKTI